MCGRWRIRVYCVYTGRVSVAVWYCSLLRNLFEFSAHKQTVAFIQIVIVHYWNCWWHFLIDYSRSCVTTPDNLTSSLVYSWLPVVVRSILFVVDVRSYIELFEGKRSSGRTESICPKSWWRSRVRVNCSWRVVRVRAAVLEKRNSPKVLCWLEQLEPRLNVS